jgi:pimeloyl-ACP methyl ester carboxylesterase
MPIHEVNGIRINYVQFKCGAGKTCEDLVMVHGLGTNLAFWYMPHAVAFSGQYRVTLFDLRGHGRSSMPLSGYQPMRLARDLEALLDALGIERAHFVAHSFGGVVALCLASLEHGRFIDLVLADTQVYAVRHKRREREWEFGKTLQRLLDQHQIDIKVKDPYFGYHLLDAIARLEVQNKRLSPELADLLGPLVGRNTRRTARQWLQLLSTTNAEVELMTDDHLTADRLRELRFPILAIYGERSHSLHCGEWLSQIWDQASFCRVPGAGHFFPMSRPLVFMEACRRFWQDTSVAGEVPAPVVVNEHDTAISRFQTARIQSL